MHCVVWENCLSSREKTLRQRLKEELVLHLFDLLLTNPDFEQSFVTDVDFCLRLARTSLGQPLLIAGERAAACVSFSYTYRDLWGAISEHAWLCGVDAALAEDFDSSFPKAKVFSQEELGAGALVEKDRRSLTALLWSAKESVVKAAGCGFHLITPLDVKLDLVSHTLGMVLFEVSLPKLWKYPDFVFPGGFFHVLSFVHGDAWISVALCKNTRPSVSLNP